ncbi:pancreatic alpha-amylase-like isoform X2 [Labeo rohita]|uniref:alpha-amylase n=2 Tax=Labeo rohita TaxID=84645 RepID=A0A498LT63_LABRO|nr:pancreatic alpha-amylase-like isoform X2 [Labeo rohita]
MAMEEFRYVYIDFCEYKDRSGTEAELQDMITRCNNVGVNIYVDVVINHMCKSFHGEGTPSSCGSYFNGNKEDFPSVPYSYLDFNDGKCKSGSGNIENYHDIYQVRDCRLEDLLDLALEKDYVRGKLADYLNKLIELGVAGFRVDACKHMWPGDLTNVYGRLKTLNTKWFPTGTKPFIYQEVIDLGGEPITASEYHGLARVTEFKHSAKLGTVVRKWDGEKLSYLKNWGEGWGFMPSDKAVVFVDNHDNQRGHGAGGASVLTFWDSRLYKIAAGLMLAHPYGVTRVMSSYRWERKIVNGKDENDWMGPPSYSDGSTKPVPINPDSTCGDNWVCEHRWRQIRNMAIFRNVANGQPLSNWWDNGNNQIAFSRGNKGFIIINNDDWALDVTLNTGLPMGTYCDVISGDKSGSSCTGKQHASERNDCQERKKRRKTSFEKLPSLDSSSSQGQKVEDQTSAAIGERRAEDETKQTSFITGQKRKRCSLGHQVYDSHYSTPPTSSTNAAENHLPVGAGEEREMTMRKKRRTKSHGKLLSLKSTEQSSSSDQAMIYERQVEDYIFLQSISWSEEDLEESVSSDLEDFPPADHQNPSAPSSAHKSRVDLTTEDDILSQYEIGKRLGKGGFGCVCEGKRLEDGLEVAVKIARKPRNMKNISVPGHPAPIPLEISLLLLVNKESRVPEIIKLLDWQDQPKRYIMVLEHPSPCKDLWDYTMLQGGFLSEDTARSIMAQATKAAHMCCQRGVFHRDIKMENLLVNLETLEAHQSSARLQYHVDHKYHGKPTTVWSLGILLFLLVCGSFPEPKDTELIDDSIWFRDELSNASTFGNTVYQTPSKSIKERDESAVFICTHSIAGYYQMMWYKQTQGTLGFKLMGYLNGETDQIETDFKNKIDLKGNGGSNGTLTIKDLALKLNHFKGWDSLHATPKLNMSRGIIALILLLHWSQDTEGADDVIQEPKMIWKPKSGSASLNCSHNKDVSYNQMYWYRQRPGETMRLIVFSTTGKAEFGDVDEKKFDAQKSDAESGSLTVKDLAPDDSGVYFCAVEILSDGILLMSQQLKFQSQRTFGLLSTAVGEDVLQKPAILYELKGKSAQINCTHNKDSDYRLMYWYRQRQGQTMRLVAFTTSYSDPEYGDSEPNKFVANKTVPESGSLTVDNLELDDSAIYFCSTKSYFLNVSFIFCKGANVMKTLLSICVHLMMLAAACLGETVLQTPDDLLKKPDESAVISCTHNIQYYDRILWYKQSHNVSGFELMGYLFNKDDTKEPGFEKKIELKGDGQKMGTLNISNLTPTDSAVYFCAAWYTVLRITSS